MKEEGIIVELKEDLVIVEIKPHEECHKCGSCGAARPRRITVFGEQVQGLSVGDKVQIEMDSSTMLKIYSLLYGIPLVVFTGTVLFLYFIIQSPLMSFTGAIILTALSYIITGLYTRRSNSLTPRMTRI
jgi:positive regulator of sigma E activity